LDLEAHEELAKGALLLQAAGYALHQQLNLIPRGSNNHWNQIRSAWKALEQQKLQARSGTSQNSEELSPRYENYLYNIDNLIDVTQQLERDKYKLSKPILYTKVDSAGEERHGLHDIYVFHLADSSQVPNEKYMLRIKETPELVGRIFAVKGRRLTVKFERLIDRLSIPEQGNLEIIYSNVIFKAQHKAVKMLREREAKSPHLLHVLVDHRYQNYRQSPLLNEKLNDEQRQAFQYALTVPDMLLVLGPPGTGKTRTITEIVRQCSSQRQRVLVTSGTHKAVDNVLRLLSEPSEIVRLGHEGNVADDTRHLLIDEKAKKMQTAILESTKRQATMLSHFLDDKNQIVAWWNALAHRVTQLYQSEQDRNSVHQREEQIVQRIGAPYRPAIDKITASLQEQGHKLDRLERKVAMWQEKKEQAESKRQMFIVGRLFSLLSNHYIKSIERALERINAMRETLYETEQQHAANHTAMQQALWNDSDYRICVDNRQRIEAFQAVLHREATKLIGMLQGTIQELIPDHPQITPFTAQTLQQYLHWYGNRGPLVERKALLMRDWRAKLAERTEQLRPELLRYADVVGATCIGIATVEGLEDVDFDLAIVDEAGQVCLPDLLVPLVRAKRAVLVGDHQQLPPFVGNEVQNWLDSLSCSQQEGLRAADDELDGKEIADLLKKSTFEHLLRQGVDNAHFVGLTNQFRMPRIIADFASQHFYSGQLRTPSGDKRIHIAEHDPRFQRPLTLIDTSGVPPEKRKDRKRNASEQWGVSGYYNPLEAELIMRIAVAYERAGREWVIIVPYRAQAQEIIRLLQTHAETSDLILEERVSTVDSFQGGERDKVIYGFTRSNQPGEVGFLKELRRLNVAITRAKEQLVLVGDFSTLTRSTDAGFRHLATSLYEHVRQSGEYLTYEQCLQRLPSVLLNRGKDGR
jgi:hypothetical protein